MKTLDEVIKALEYCGDGNSNTCIGCPYADVDGEAACFDHDREDALQYLREYQRLQIAFLKALADLEDNPPLTWDELKGMEGKPVWVEHRLFKGWRLIGWQANDHMMNLVGPYSEQLPLFADGCGSDWQAYRKEME